MSVRGPFRACLATGATSALFWLASAAPARTQDAPTAGDPDEDIEVVVRSDLPRCRRQLGDPLDKVDVDSAPFIQSVIKQDPTTGVWRVVRDDDPITGPEIWQRAGKGIADFRFRVPTNDLPMCIGSRSAAPRGWGQLRRVLDAAPLRDRYIRFTALVATRRSSEVRFWLAAGDSGRVLQGGDTSGQPLWRTRQWVPVHLTIGPIPKTATKLSYGFLLKGSGDVWVMHPKLEILDHAEPGPGVRALGGRSGE
ncbi:hypothetical protein ACMGDH_06125 [Sphingomonas sp. DT-207]|uniref:hypothetical protein n=1 Tax=Sphingomonas sp. DT-207 TaxID=3396167 RepID=UPI003F197FA9